MLRRCAMMVSPNSSRETTRPSKCLHPFSPPQGLHKRHRFNGTTPVSFGLSRLSIATCLSMAGLLYHGTLRIRQQQALQERFVSRPPRAARWIRTKWRKLLGRALGVSSGRLVQIHHVLTEASSSGASFFATVEYSKLENRGTLHRADGSCRSIGDRTNLENVCRGSERINRSGSDSVLCKRERKQNQNSDESLVEGIGIFYF